MQSQLKRLSIFCLLAWLAYVSFAFAEGAGKRHFVMGGSVGNLRAISKQDADTTFNIYLADLYKQYNADWTLRIEIYSDVPALLKAFDKGEIDGYFGTPLDYLARKDKLCKIMVATKYRGANVKQPYLLVARADSGLTTIRDLKGKRLSMAPYQDMEALYLNTILLKNKLPEIPDFFDELTSVKSPNMALMDIFFNRSDVTVVRENEYIIATELNPQLAKQLVVLDKSPPLIPVLGVVSNRISEDEFSNFLLSFKKITQTDRGRNLMALVQVEDVAKISPDDLSAVEDLLNEQNMFRALNAMAPKKGDMPDKKKVKRNAQ